MPEKEETVDLKRLSPDSLWGELREHAADPPRKVVLYLDGRSLPEEAIARWGEVVQGVHKERGMPTIVALCPVLSDGTALELARAGLQVVEVTDEDAGSAAETLVRRSLNEVTKHTYLLAAVRGTSSPDRRDLTPPTYSVSAATSVSGVSTYGKAPTHVDAESYRSWIEKLQSAWQEKDLSDTES